MAWSMEHAPGLGLRLGIVVVGTIGTHELDVIVIIFALYLDVTTITIGITYVL